MRKSSHIQLASVYLLAGLVMTYASYQVPAYLPGDFVTAMYSSSNVTLTADQEIRLRAFHTREEGFKSYLLNLFRLNWGYSHAFLAPVSDLVLEALPWTLL
ncbi:MAG: ABC transporter permease, partial [Desulfobacterales bacterium]|nr:ABC transporter permease [Desulfobacterales bacterium]